jgi:hypothetical protein
MLTQNSHITHRVHPQYQLHTKLESKIHSFTFSMITAEGDSQSQTVEGFLEQEKKHQVKK